MCHKCKYSLSDYSKAAEWMGPNMDPQLPKQFQDLAQFINAVLPEMGGYHTRMKKHLHFDANDKNNKVIRGAIDLFFPTTTKIALAIHTTHQGEKLMKSYATQLKLEFRFDRSETQEQARKRREEELNRVKPEIRIPSSYNFDTVIFNNFLFEMRKLFSYVDRRSKNTKLTYPETVYYDDEGKTVSFNIDV